MNPFNAPLFRRALYIIAIAVTAYLSGEGYISAAVKENTDSLISALIFTGLTGVTTLAAVKTPRKFKIPSIPEEVAEAPLTTDGVPIISDSDLAEIGFNTPYTGKHQ